MKMSKLGPKCQFFVWPPLFYNTALTFLGMEFTRASQVATGFLFFSSMMTSWSWCVLETLRSSIFHLRMPHKYSMGFRSGDKFRQSITFTISFFSKAVVVIMLGYCAAAQSPTGGDHALLQNVTVHVVFHGSLNELYIAPQCRQHSCSPRPSLEEASFWDNSHADQFDAVCGVWPEH